MDEGTDFLHISINKEAGSLLGRGPIDAARLTLLQTLAAEEVLAHSMARDNYTPNLVIRTPETKTSTEAQTVLDTWMDTRDAGGPRGQGRKRPAVLGGGADIEQITFSPVDAQWIESRNFHIQQVGRIFGLSGFFLLVDSGSSLTYSTTESTFRLFLNQTLRPTYLENIEQQFSRLLPSGRKAKFNADEILRADQLARYQANSTALGGAAFKVVNEVRAEEGLSAIPGGDELIAVSTQAKEPASSPERRTSQMTDIFFLDEDQPLEVRDFEQRIVGGRIVPFGETIQVRGKPESFTMGAFADVNPNQVKLLRDHDRGKPLGKMIALQERAGWGTRRVPDQSYPRRRRGSGTRQRRGAGLLGRLLSRRADQTGSPHPSQVTPRDITRHIQPLPGRSKSSTVREKEVPLEPETETQEVIPEVRDLDLTPLENRMDGFQSSLDKLQALAEAPEVRTLPVGGPTPLQWFAAQLEAIDGRSHQRRDKLEEDWANFQTRVADTDFEIEARFLCEDQWETRQSSLQDVTGDFPGATPIVDASGLVVEQYISSQLVNVLDTRRPLLTRLGRFPGPRSGYAQIPIVTQHTEVGARGAQKSAIHSRKMIIVKQSFEAQWYDGGVDVALELIRSSEINVLDFIWSDLVGQFAIVSEGAIVEQIDASTAWTEEGAALTLTSYAEFIKDVATQALVVQRNSGAPATRLAVTEAQWPQILGLTDGIGRRVFATSGPTER